MNAAEIARAVFSRGTSSNGEQIVCVDALTIEDVYVLCRAVLDAEASREMVKKLQTQIEALQLVLNSREARAEQLTEKGNG